MENKITALIVDDDKFLLDMYSLKLAKNNIEAITIGSTEEALNKLREGLSPDIILLDIVMPTMTGLELLAILRKEKLVEKATVIMLSNQNQPSDIDKAKEIGIDGYITKANTIPSEVVTQVIAIHTGKEKKV